MRILILLFLACVLGAGSTSAAEFQTPAVQMVPVALPASPVAVTMPAISRQRLACEPFGCFLCDNAGNFTTTTGL